MHWFFGVCLINKIFIFLTHFYHGDLCVKGVRIQSYFGPHFLAFGLNTERYGVSLRIQSKYGKYLSVFNPNADYNNSGYGHFLRSVFSYSVIWISIASTLIIHLDLRGSLPPHDLQPTFLSNRNVFAWKQYHMISFFKRLQFHISTRRICLI